MNNLDRILFRQMEKKYTTLQCCLIKPERTNLTKKSTWCILNATPFRLLTCFPHFLIFQSFICWLQLAMTDWIEHVARALLIRGYSIYNDIKKKNSDKSPVKLVETWQCLISSNNTWALGTSLSRTQANFFRQFCWHDDGSMESTGCSSEPTSKKVVMQHFTRPRVILHSKCAHASALLFVTQCALDTTWRIAIKIVSNIWFMESLKISRGTATTRREHSVQWDYWMRCGLFAYE